jgi:hypothetical protein
MFTSKTLTAHEILQSLNVDDGAFPFGTRDDLMKGMELIYHHFCRFGMKMHIGRGTSQSKTECVFSPPLVLPTLAMLCWSYLNNPTRLPARANQ